MNDPYSLKGESLTKNQSSAATQGLKTAPETAQILACTVVENKNSTLTSGPLLKAKADGSLTYATTGGTTQGRWSYPLQDSSSLSHSSSTVSSSWGVIGTGTRKPRNTWSPLEDEALWELVGRSKTSQPAWTKIAVRLNEYTGSRRTHKQCRERWLNHLRPGLKKGDWSLEEEGMIRYFHNAFGKKWSAMAKVMTHRSEADIKNKWYSMQRTEQRQEGTASSGLETQTIHTAMRHEYERTSWMARDPETADLHSVHSQLGQPSTLLDPSNVQQTEADEF